MHYLIHEQAKDSDCHQASFTVGLPGLPFNYDTNGLLRRTASTNKVVQKAIPTSLQLRLLHHSSYPSLAGHSGERHMFDSVPIECYWPHMGNDFYTSLKDCLESAWNKPFDRRRRVLQVFPPSGRLEFESKTLHGIQVILVVTERYSKLAEGLPTSRTIAGDVASLFIDNCILPCESTTHVLTDDRTQVLRIFFEALCIVLGTKDMTTTAHHPQTNRQVECFNKTMIAILWHYAVEHQRYWDIYVQQLTTSIMPRCINRWIYYLSVSFYHATP